MITFILLPPHFLAAQAATNFFAGQEKRRGRSPAMPSGDKFALYFLHGGLYFLRNENDDFFQYFCVRDADDGVVRVIWPASVIYPQTAVCRVECVRFFHLLHEIVNVV